MSLTWALSALKDMVRQMKNSDALYLASEFHKRIVQTDEKH